jgi:hypothetical protein
MSEKRTNTAFTVVISHRVSVDPCEIANVLQQHLMTAEDTKGVLEPVKPLCMARTPEPHDARLYHEIAVRQGLQMFTDDMAPAIVAYVKQHGAMPEHDHEVEGYGGFSYDPQQQLAEHYNLSEEMAGVGALENAACIIESGLFDHLKPSLDGGSWQEENDPVQSVKNMADDLYTLLVSEVCTACWKAFKRILAERALNLEELIAAAVEEVQDKYSDE